MAFKARLADKKIKNIEYKTATSAPLPSLLAEADWHVTPYSSAAYEASAYGVPTIFVHSFGTENHGYLAGMSGFFFESATDAILNLLGEKHQAESVVEKDIEKAKTILCDLASGNI